MAFWRNDMNAKDLFEILVRENADMLLTYVRSSIRDDATADDVFQETMLTAWRRLDDYDKERPFGPWLRGIAAKVLLTHWRKSARGAELCDAATLDYLSVRFEQVHRQPGDTFDDKLSTLRDCVEHLPKAYRESIQLRYGEELQPAALAERTGIALAAVKKRLLRAKTRLLDCIRRKLQVPEVSP